MKKRMKRLSDEEIKYEINRREKDIGKELGRRDNLPPNNPENYGQKDLDKAYHQLEIILDAISDYNIYLKRVYET